MLVDGEVTIRDSQAILVYLASKHGGAAWWPSDPAQQGQIAAWLSTAATEVANGLALLRLHYKSGKPADLEATRTLALRVLDVLENHLASSDYLTGDNVSIADLAVYPYVALAPEAKIDLGSYRSVLAWFKRLRALPGYAGREGMWD